MLQTLLDEKLPPEKYDEVMAFAKEFTVELISALFDELKDYSFGDLLADTLPEYFDKKENMSRSLQFVRFVETAFGMMDQLTLKDIEPFAFLTKLVVNQAVATLTFDFDEEYKLTAIRSNLDLNVDTQVEEFAINLLDYHFAPSIKFNYAPEFVLPEVEKEEYVTPVTPSEIVPIEFPEPSEEPIDLSAIEKDGDLYAAILEHARINGTAEVTIVMDLPIYSEVTDMNQVLISVGEPEMPGSFLAEFPYTLCSSTTLTLDSLFATYSDKLDTIWAFGAAVTVTTVEDYYFHNAAECWDQGSQTFNPEVKEPITTSNSFMITVCITNDGIALLIDDQNIAITNDQIMEAIFAYVQENFAIDPEKIDIYELDEFSRSVLLLFDACADFVAENKEYVTEKFTLFFRCLNEDSFAHMANVLRGRDFGGKIELTPNGIAVTYVSGLAEKIKLIEDFVTAVGDLSVYETINLIADIAINYDLPDGADPTLFELSDFLHGLVPLTETKIGDILSMFGIYGVDDIAAFINQIPDEDFEGLFLEDGTPITKTLLIEQLSQLYVICNQLSIQEVLGQIIPNLYLVGSPLSYTEQLDLYVTAFIEKLQEYTLRDLFNDVVAALFYARPQEPDIKILETISNPLFIRNPHEYTLLNALDLRTGQIKSGQIKFGSLATGETFVSDDTLFATQYKAAPAQPVANLIVKTIPKPAPVLKLILKKTVQSAVSQILQPVKANGLRAGVPQIVNDAKKAVATGVQIVSAIPWKIQRVISGITPRLPEGLRDKLTLTRLPENLHFKLLKTVEPKETEFFPALLTMEQSKINAKPESEETPVLIGGSNIPRSTTATLQGVAAKFRGVNQQALKITLGTVLKKSWMGTMNEPFFTETEVDGLKETPREPSAFLLHGLNSLLTVFHKDQGSGTETIVTPGVLFIAPLVIYPFFLVNRFANTELPIDEIESGSHISIELLYRITHVLTAHKEILARLPEDLILKGQKVIDEIIVKEEPGIHINFFKWFTDNLLPNTKETDVSENEQRVTHFIPVFDSDHPTLLSLITQQIPHFGVEMNTPVVERTLLIEKLLKPCYDLSSTTSQLLKKLGMPYTGIVNNGSDAEKADGIHISHLHLNPYTTIIGSLFLLRKSDVPYLPAVNENRVSVAKALPFWISIGTILLKPLVYTSNEPQADALSNDTPSAPTIINPKAGSDPFVLSVLVKGIWNMTKKIGDAYTEVDCMFSDSTVKANAGLHSVSFSETVNATDIGDAHPEFSKIIPQLVIEGEDDIPAIIDPFGGEIDIQPHGTGDGPTGGTNVISYGTLIVPVLVTIVITFVIINYILF